MKGTITQFDLALLPKVSREELEFRKLFPHFAVDADALSSIINDALASIETPDLKRLSLRLESARLETTASALSVLDPNQLCVFASLADLALPAVLVIGRPLAKELVYSLLGSENEIESGTGQLTPIEEGVFSFILSTVLFALHEQLSERLGLSVRLGSLTSLATVHDVFANESRVINLSFRTDLEPSHNGIQLIIGAHPALSAFFQNSAYNEDCVARGFERVHNASVRLSAVVGEIKLGLDELESLQVEDIVLIDKSGAKEIGGALSGHLEAALGDPAFVRLPAQISVSEAGHYTLQMANA